MGPGRNDPCPCGSGKKYKKCCLPKEEAAAVLDSGWLRIRRTEGELTARLGKHLARHYGPDALDEAWEEYTLWPDPPAEQDEWPEFESSFLPWLVFDWEPDIDESGEARDRPAICPARHYAETQSANLDSYVLRYIEAACGAAFTFYLIVAVEPGRSITLRDIFLEGEVTVRERQASTTLRPGQIIFTKVVSLDGSAVMLGCAPYAIPGNRFDAIAQLREVIASSQDLNLEALREYDTELRQLYLELREDILNPAPPRVQNTDGEPLQLTRIDYELLCPPQEAFAALLPLTLEDDPDAFADECERDEDGALVAVQIPWLRAGNAQNPQWPNTLLGQIDIRRGAMKVNVNSQARADAIRAEISARLGERVLQKAIVIDSIEHRMAQDTVPDTTRSRADEESEALMRTPEVQALMAKMNAEHWRTWPDIPLPALGGKTPREAAKTPAGRERLEVLLLDFEAHKDDPGAMAPDIEALRRELGI